MEKAQTQSQWSKLPPKKDIKKRLMDALSRINYDNDSTFSSDTNYENQMQSLYSHALKSIKKAPIES